jgi:hypothetical protein
VCSVLGLTTTSWPACRMAENGWEFCSSRQQAGDTAQGGWAAAIRCIRRSLSKAPLLFMIWRIGAASLRLRPRVTRCRSTRSVGRPVLDLSHRPDEKAVVVHAGKLPLLCQLLRVPGAGCIAERSLPPDCAMARRMLTQRLMREVDVGYECARRTHSLPSVARAGMLCSKALPNTVASPHGTQ